MIERDQLFVVEHADLPNKVIHVTSPCSREARRNSTFQSFWDLPCALRCCSGSSVGCFGRSSPPRNCFVSGKSHWSGLIFRTLTRSRLTFITRDEKSRLELWSLMWWVHSVPELYLRWRVSLVFEVFFLELRCLTLVAKQARKKMLIFWRKHYTWQAINREDSQSTDLLTILENLPLVVRMLMSMLLWLFIRMRSEFALLVWLEYFVDLPGRFSRDHAWPTHSSRRAAIRASSFSPRRNSCLK